MNRHATRAVATVAVRVPLGASGDLADGAARVVERATAVESVESLEITGLQPGLNDTVVTAEVELALADSVPATREELVEVVGVRRVDALVAQEVEAPDRAEGVGVG